MGSAAAASKIAAQLLPTHTPAHTHDADPDIAPARPSTGKPAIGKPRGPKHGRIPLPSDVRTAWS